MQRTSLFLFAVSSLVLVSACEPPPAPRGFSAPDTSRVGMSEDGRVLYVALADHDVVRAIDVESQAVIGETSVAGEPHRLSVLSDGRIAVAARRAGTVTILDDKASSVIARLAVGSDPFGVIEQAGRLVVAVAGERELAVIDLADLSRVLARVPLEYAEPRGLARLPDGRVAVSHFNAGTISLVDLDAINDKRAIDMRLRSRPFFFPNQLDQLTATESGDLLAPHVECNNDPAQFGANGTASADLVGVPVQYYVAGTTGFPAVVPAVSVADGVAAQLRSDDTTPRNESGVTLPEQAGAANPLINPLDSQTLATERDGSPLRVNAPVAVARVDDGQLEIVVNQGSGNAIVRRVHLEEGQNSIIGYVDVGVGASSIAIAPDGNTAYVFNELDHTVTTIEVPRSDPRQISRFVEEPTPKESESTGMFGSPIYRKEPLRRLASDRFAVAEEVLPPEVAEGRRLFFGVSDNVTSFGAISCNSCHPGGEADATTWSFAEGPRQTPALWGGILETAPFHWDQLVSDMADINRVTVQGRMGGSGLSPEQMQAIGAYLDRIPSPAPSAKLEASAIERGQEIFDSSETGCRTCHDGPHFSDNLAHDVGTGPGAGPGYTERETQSAFATPVLHGLARTAPYLHNGEAATIRDVLEILVVTDRMGKGSHLSDDELDDLEAFLQSL